MLIDQVERTVWIQINGHLSSQKHRRFQTTVYGNYVRTDYTKYSSFYYMYPEPLIKENKNIPNFLNFCFKSKRELSILIT